MSTNIFATTVEGIEIPLSFDESTKYISPEFNLPYLVLTREKISFPSKTKLGKRQKMKFQKALDIMEIVINSEEFKRLVISYQRKIGTNPSGDPIYERSFSKNYLWNNSKARLTNEEIYNIIMLGNEKMRPNTHGEINFNSYVKICSRYQLMVRNINWCNGTIGSTKPSSSKMIKLNWKFYKKYETHEMLANMVHEWVHLLGFLHGESNIHQEVPYVVGAIVKKLAKNISENKIAKNSY